MGNRYLTYCFLNSAWILFSSENDKIILILGIYQGCFPFLVISMIAKLQSAHIICALNIKDVDLFPVFLLFMDSLTWKSYEVTIFMLSKGALFEYSALKLNKL